MKRRATTSSCGYVQLSERVGTGKGVIQINNFTARKRYQQWAHAACAPACQFSTPTNNLPRHSWHQLWQSFGRRGDQRGPAARIYGHGSAAEELGDCDFYSRSAPRVPKARQNPIFEGLGVTQRSYGSPEGCQHPAGFERPAQSHTKRWRNLPQGSTAQLTVNSPRYQGEEHPANTDRCTNPHRTANADKRHQKKQFLDVFLRFLQPAPAQLDPSVLTSTRGEG